VPFAATLRPSMQEDGPTLQSPQPVRRRARAGTPGNYRPGRGAIWEPASDASTPRSLLAITPPRGTAVPACRHGASSPTKGVHDPPRSRDHRENLPPFNSSPPRSARGRARSRGRPTPPRASSSKLLEESLDISASPSPHAVCIAASPGDSCRSTPVRGTRAMSRSSQKLHAIGDAPPRNAGTHVLVSHIDHLRSALRAAYGKLDALEQERGALKEQLAEVVSDSGAHAARMRVLEKQLQAVRRQDESNVSSALAAAQQKSEAQRKSLSHKERELAVLSGELEERDGQVVQLRLERDAAREEIEALRGDIADLNHGMQSLQESLRLMEERNADLVCQLAALGDELQQTKSRNNALSLLMAFNDDMPVGYNEAERSGKTGAALRFRTEGSTPSSEELPREDLGRILAWLPSLEPHRRAQRVDDAAIDENGPPESAEGPSSARWPDGYVRKEVLEQVKMKAKADLAELESELMAVILRMEAEHKEYASQKNDRSQAAGDKPAATSEFSPVSIRSPVSTCLRR